MSEDLINQITLNCLMNKKQYEKYVASQVSKSMDEEERKFYRKRIYCLTKELLLSKEEPQNLLPDVKYAFDNYVKSCIHFFKVSDSHDILQKEYTDMEEPQDNNTRIEVLDNILNENDASNNDLIQNNNNIDQSLIRSIKSIHTSLDQFVTITSTKKTEEMILPKQREVNLNDPTLMNKGVFHSEKKKY
jgi:hypothetical protein